MFLVLYSFRGCYSYGLRVISPYISFVVQARVLLPAPRLDKRCLYVECFTAEREVVGTQLCSVVLNINEWGFSSRIACNNSDFTIWQRRRPWKRRLKIDYLWLSQEALLLKRREFQLELKRKDRARVQTEMIEIIALPFATFTSPIMQLICLPKFCISIVYNFFWDCSNTQEKWKTKIMQNIFFVGEGVWGGK